LIKECVECRRGRATWSKVVCLRTKLLRVLRLQSLRSQRKPYFCCDPIAATTAVAAASSNNADTTPTNTAKSSGGLSENDRVGLGTGIGVGVPAFIVALICVIHQCKKGR